MVNEENIILNPMLYDEGKKLLKILDKTEIKPSAAFWFYFTDQKLWRLLIASSIFDEMLAQDRYRKFIQIINSSDFSQLEVGDIALIASNDPLVQLFKVAIRTNSDTISKIEFKTSTINGIFIENSIIYRMS